MRVELRPFGSGNHSPLILTWNSRLRAELPLGLDVRRGQKFILNGFTYRVSRVWP